MSGYSRKRFSSDFWGQWGSRVTCFTPAAAHRGVWVEISDHHSDSHRSLADKFSNNICRQQTCARPRIYFILATKDDTAHIKPFGRTASVKLQPKNLSKWLTSDSNFICSDRVHEVWLITSVELNTTIKRPCNRSYSQQFLFDILLHGKAADVVGQHNSFGPSEAATGCVFVLMVRNRNRIQHNGQQIQQVRLEVPTHTND